MRLRIYFGGASPNCGAGVRPYPIRRPALAHKNPTRFSRGSMSTTLRQRAVINSPAVGAVTIPTNACNVSALCAATEKTRPRVSK